MADGGQVQHEAELAHDLISQHIDNVAEQSSLRADLLQSEIDRRFSTLQAQIDQLLVAARERAVTLQLQLDQRFEAEIQARKAALEAANLAVQAALKSAETAVNKAEAAAERRFDSVNEFRKTLTDQTGSFPTRNEVTVRMDSLAAQVDRNAALLRDIELRFTSRLDTAQARLSGASENRTEQRLSQGAVVSIVVALVITAGLVVSILTLVHK